MSQILHNCKDVGTWHSHTFKTNRLKPALLAALRFLLHVTVRNIVLAHHFPKIPARLQFVDGVSSPGFGVSLRVFNRSVDRQSVVIHTP